MGPLVLQQKSYATVYHLAYWMHQQKNETLKIIFLYDIIIFLMCRRVNGRLSFHLILKLRYYGYCHP